MRRLNRCFNILKIKLLCIMIMACMTTAPGIWAGQDSLNSILKTLQSVESEEVQLNMLKGVLDGLNGVKTIPAPESWNEVNNKLEKSKNSKVLASLMLLKQKFGDEEAIQNAIKDLKDESLDLSKRRSILSSCSFIKALNY